MFVEKIHAVVIGLGRAGKARQRILESDPRFKVRAHRWRDLSIEGLEKLAGTIFFVCTANDTHYIIAKKLLSMGKDVVVEFPPCATRDEWRELRDLAHNNDAHIHCALIGLYTAAHTQRKVWLEQHGASRIEIDFQGGYYRWLMDEAKKGHHLLLAFSRLVSLWSLCGALSIERLTVEQQEDGYHLQMQGTGEGGEEIYLSERRKIGLKRSTTWKLVSPQGVQPLHPPAMG